MTNKILFKLLGTQLAEALELVLEENNLQIIEKSNETKTDTTIQPTINPSDSTGEGNTQASQPSTGEPTTDQPTIQPDGGNGSPEQPKDGQAPTSTEQPKEGEQGSGSISNDSTGERNPDDSRKWTARK